MNSRNSIFEKHTPLTADALRIYVENGPRKYLELFLRGECLVTYYSTFSFTSSPSFSHFSIDVTDYSDPKRCKQVVESYWERLEDEFSFDSPLLITPARYIDVFLRGMPIDRFLKHLNASQDDRAIRASLGILETSFDRSEISRLALDMNCDHIVRFLAEDSYFSFDFSLSPSLP